MINLFTLLLVLSIAGALGFYYVPWVGRLLALYALHGTRNRVYLMGEQSPIVCQSTLYKDVLMILATMIHVVRERRLRDAATLTGMLSQARRRAASENAQPRTRYANDLDEVFVGEAGIKALSELLDATTTAELALVLRVVTGHPLLLTLTCSIGVVAWLGLALKDWFDRLSHAFQGSSRAIVPMAKFIAKQNAVSQGARRLGLPRSERSGALHAQL
jgi:hypothetical protein